MAAPFFCLPACRVQGEDVEVRYQDAYGLALKVRSGRRDALEEWSQLSVCAELLMGLYPALLTEESENEQTHLMIQVRRAGDGRHLLNTGIARTRF